MHQQTARAGLYQGKMIIDANYDTLVQGSDSCKRHHSRFIAEKIITDNWLWILGRQLIQVQLRQQRCRRAKVI